MASFSACVKLEKFLSLIEKPPLTRYWQIDIVRCCPSNTSNLFSATACEMEGASIAHVCYINKTPFCVMRVISDGGDEAASFDYSAFALSAANCGINIIKSLFLDLKNSWNEQVLFCSDGH